MKTIFINIRNFCGDIFLTALLCTFVFGGKINISLNKDVNAVFMNIFAIVVFIVIMIVGEENRISKEDVNG